MVRTFGHLCCARGTSEDRNLKRKPGRGGRRAKQFQVAELSARVESPPRSPITARETVLRVGPLRLDLIDRTARRGNRPIRLLPREFKLLEYMMRRSGQVLTRAELLEDLWNTHYLAETNVLDVHIGKLRRKIDAADENRLIHCVRGTGFMLVDLS